MRERAAYSIFITLVASPLLLISCGNSENNNGTGGSGGGTGGGGNGPGLDASPENGATGGSGDGGMDAISNPNGTGGANCASLAGDFSPTGMNPLGDWSYGWSSMLGTSFNIFTLFLPGTNPTLTGLPMWSSAELKVNSGAYLPALGINAGATAVAPYGTYTVQPGQIIAHPGPTGQYAIARWTAPIAGTYRVEATFVGLSGLNGAPVTTTDVHVQQNGSDILSGAVNINGSGNSYSDAAIVTVAPRDTIDLAVGYGNGTYLYDSTGVNGIVCKSQ